MTRLRLRQPEGLTRKVTEILVGGPIARWFVRHGWGGVTLPVTPWRTVILYWEPPTARDRVHEFVHVRQIQQLGGLRFLRLWLRLTRRHGYHGNPLEVIAYEIERSFEREALGLAPPENDWAREDSGMLPGQGGSH